MAIENSDVEQVYNALVSEGVIPLDKDRVRFVLETGEKEPAGTPLRGKYLEFSLAAEKYFGKKVELKERGEELVKDFVVSWGQLEQEVKTREETLAGFEKARAARVEEARVERERAEEVGAERERAERAPPTPPPPAGPPTTRVRVRAPQPPRTPLQEVQRRNQVLSVASIIVLLLLFVAVIYAAYLKSRYEKLSHQNVVLLENNAKYSSAISDLHGKLGAAETKVAVAKEEKDRIEASCFEAEDVNRLEQEHSKTVEQMLFSAERDCREGKEKTADLTARETAKLMVEVCNQLRYVRRRSGEPGT